jgi:perosamine synthetase
MTTIRLAEPTLTGNERRYVLECLDTNWISSIGRFITDFENSFAQFCDVRHAIATNNGTTALHLALVALGVGPGDEVIVPTLTYIATANAVRYCGATPVFADSLDNSLNIDPIEVKRAIGPRTKGILPVHLYGEPAEMTAINALADEHDLWVLEDAAEAHGATVDGRPVGSLGRCATFSFFGNKIVTTGEGGMVTTNDDELADRLRLLRGQGMDPTRRYWFPVIGFNYRMTNIQAAIGLAQMETIQTAIEHRAELAAEYDALLSASPEHVELSRDKPGCTRVHWVYNVFLRNGSEVERDQVMSRMGALGVETRPVFYPMHKLPPYAEDREYSVAEQWARRGITLPLHQGLDRADVQQVVETLLVAIGGQ